MLYIEPHWIITKKDALQIYRVASLYWHSDQFEAQFTSRETQAI